MTTRRRTVTVVDDDDLSRAGIELILGRDERLEVHAALTHEEALSTEGWWDVDVVVVDAADQRRGEDHFPGVDVVRAVRRTRTREQTAVIVVTGHFFDDAVRYRMREAKADLFFHRTEVQDAQTLCDIVADPASIKRVLPEPQNTEEMFRHGIGAQTRINDAVGFAKRQGWLDGELHVPGRRPRSFDRLRSTFAQTGRVHTVNTDGTMPDRDQQDPSRPQIARLLDWATKSKWYRP